LQFLQAIKKGQGKEQNRNKTGTKTGVNIKIWPGVNEVKPNE